MLSCFCFVVTYFSLLVLRCPSNQFMFPSLLYYPSPLWLSKLVFDQIGTLVLLAQLLIKNEGPNRLRPQSLTRPQVKSLALPWIMGLPTDFLYPLSML
jgi:hypothetical protein